jgi:uncharacterized protein (DUF58 family)
LNPEALMAEPRERVGRSDGPPPSARVHVTLDDLVRLKGRAKGFSFLPRQPVHSVLAGRHGSRLRGRGLDFEELRHYQYGDDPRSMDWLATARLGSPYVRVFTEERDREVLLLVDQRLTMFFGSRRAMKSVAAAEVAALAAWRVAALGDRIGALIFSDDDILEFLPGARSPAVMRILNGIVTLNCRLKADASMAASPGALNEALWRATRRGGHDWLVCIVTDASGADPESRRLVTRLTQHNDVIAVLIYDPLEASLPDIGRAVVARGDAQIEVDTGRRDLRTGFAGEFDDLRARIERLSRERRIPLLPISTARDPADQLREILGHRASSSRASAAQAAGSGG